MGFRRGGAERIPKARSAGGGDVVSHCSGCGGRGHSPGGYYGHILGCGTPDSGIIGEPNKLDPKFSEHRNEYRKREQLGVIEHALRKSGFDPKLSDTFADNLKFYIVDHVAKCKAAEPGKCEHVDKSGLPSSRPWP